MRLGTLERRRGTGCSVQKRERELSDERGEAVGAPPTRFLCGPQLCCCFGPRNETLPANNPTRVSILPDDPALTGDFRGLSLTPEAIRPRQVSTWFPR